MKLKRIVAITFFFLLLTMSAMAQYGNEWIVPGQSYFKFSTAKNGLYAISYAELQAAGVDMSVNPKRYQLFHRGVEQTIYIDDESDNQFNPSDTLFFYGTINDGTLDASLYYPQSSQPHQYYNLYNDTTAYFLTYAPGFSAKRMNVNAFNTPSSPELFHRTEYLKLYNDDYSRGKEYGDATQSYGDRGETWCTNRIDGTFTETIPLSNVYSASDSFIVEVMIVGRNNTANRITAIRIGNLSGPDIVDTFPVFSFQDKSYFYGKFSAALLTSSNLTVTVDGSTFPNNTYSVAYMKITYPQTIGMFGSDSKKFIPANTSVNSDVQLNWGLPSLPLVVDVTNKNNVTFLSTSLSGSLLDVFVPAGTMEFYIVKSTDPLKVPVIKAVDLSPYNTTSDYIILTHSKLWAEATQYANYRSSLAGGGHAVLMADVEKIYNQFGYGEYSPVGIKRFCTYQTDNNVKVKSLFIIGKGLDLQFGIYQPYYYRVNPSYYINNSIPDTKNQDFVPPYGSPSSDIYYVMNSSYRPSMSVGRLSAKKGQDVINYLNKVIEHESLGTDYLWRKKLIHLSGGADAGQISLFSSYVNDFKVKAESKDYFAGKVVKSYVKNLNNGAVDQIAIAEDVNNGVGYITFYGHSSSSVTELDIGYVSRDIYGYMNKGKYPMLIINGCNSASCYFNYSLAEDWINTADRGAIAALGVSDIGYTGPLYNYSSAMYKAMFNIDSLRGKPAGEVMKHMLNIENFDAQTTMQMNFHGDPAVRIYTPLQPDYEISGDKEPRNDKPELKCFIKSFDSKKVTASSDSFQIGIPVKNFGIYNKNSFLIEVKREVNGKLTTFKKVKYSPVLFLDTLYFKIKGNGPAFYGLNKFTINLDCDDTIHEMDEFNNIATIEYFMSLSSVTCLFPKEYSIVHDYPVTFVAQAANLLINQRSYYFELDTSYQFNSGFKKTGVVSSGSLPKWENITLKSNNNLDSIVYYWRVRFKNYAPGEDTVWGTSSFIYIKGSPDGWSQSEAPQFIESSQTKVYMDLADSTWKFAKSQMPIVLQVYGNGSGDDFDSTLFRVGELETMFPGYWFFHCGDYKGSRGATENVSYKFNGMVAMAFNKNTVENYLIPGRYKCGRYPKPIVTPFYTSNPGEPDAFNNWLNQIPTGDYIIIGSDGNASFDAWPQYVKDNLTNNFGAQLINQANNDEPYILLARKGDAIPIKELHSDNKFAVLRLDTLIKGTYNNGTIVSTRIGPALEWGTFYQRMYSSGQDQHVFKILGEKFDGTIDTLNLNLTFAKDASNIDYVDLKPLIDAKVYPYLRLFCAVYDSSLTLDPPQLDRWQVIYRKAPEGTLDPFTAGLENYSVGTKEEGAKVCIPYIFDNISDLSFDDSLFVRVTAKGEGPLLKDTLFVIAKDSLKPGKSVRFNYCLNTKGLNGRVTMRTFVNPSIQPEEYLTNNIIETNFEVVRDKIPPVIDVMFDGVHIMDGDIVSPSPIISITLNDNSKYLLINSPDDIQIFFKSKNSSEVLIDYKTNKDIIKYGQSPGGANTYTIEYNPKNLPDGEYSIVVQGKDVNGNKSGQFYRVTFQVENASTISNFYPYPNPFSTSTKFVFTLTGRYVPDDLKIQIMTVTGKVVREITKEELGHIHIGNNKTEFSWNGTDEFGDKLANGVYLYRVIIKNKGENFEHRDTSGDKAFKREFGKIYILR